MIDNLPNTEQPEFNEFSINVTSMLKSMKNWNNGFVDTIAQAVEALLNCKDAIQTMPSLTVASRKKFLVGAQNCNKEMYEDEVYSDHVTCACSCYKFKKLCKHSVSITKKPRMIKEHLDFLRKTQGIRLLLRAHLSKHQRMPKERKVAVRELPGDQVAPSPQTPQTSRHLLRYTTTSL